MIHLFKSTALCPDDGQLENGLQYFCQSTSSSIPTICPSLTLLMAVHYIGKLKHASAFSQIHKPAIIELTCSIQIDMRRYQVHDRLCDTHHYRSIHHGFKVPTVEPKDDY